MTTLSTVRILGNGFRTTLVRGMLYLQIVQIIGNKMFTCYIAASCMDKLCNSTLFLAKIINNLINFYLINDVLLNPHNKLCVDTVFSFKLLWILINLTQNILKKVLVFTYFSSTRHYLCKIIR